MQSNPVFVSLYCTCIRSSTRRMSALRTAGDFVDVVATLKMLVREHGDTAGKLHVPEQTLQEHRLEVLIGRVSIRIVLSIRQLEPSPRPGAIHMSLPRRAFLRDLILLDKRSLKLGRPS